MYALGLTVCNISIMQTHIRGKSIAVWCFGSGSYKPVTMRTHSICLIGLNCLSVHLFPLCELSTHINLQSSRWLSVSVFAVIQSVCPGLRSKHLQTDPWIFNMWINGFHKQIPHWHQGWCQYMFMLRTESVRVFTGRIREVFSACYSVALLLKQTFC